MSEAVEVEKAFHAEGTAWVKAVQGAGENSVRDTVRRYKPRG